MMSKMKLLAVVVFTFIGLNTLTAQEWSAEQKAVKAVVQSAYVEGLQNEGDEAKIDAGFHSEFNLLGIDKNDNMWKYAIKDWKAKAVSKRSKGDLPLKGDKKVSAKYSMIDITGTAAVVKLEYYVGDKHRYTDYLSLYKFATGWKIVNKIYMEHK